MLVTVTAMAALYYREDRFESLDSGYFWLSETPDQVGSKGWDAALPRIATWVKLRDRKFPEASPILFLNTHLDHKGRKARAESASLFRAKLQETGAECRWMTYANLFTQSEASSRMLTDTLRVVQPTLQSNEGTFSGFDAKQTSGRRGNPSRPW